jgi:hypothetical protein
MMPRPAASPVRAGGDSLRNNATQHRKTAAHHPLGGKRTPVERPSTGETESLRSHSIRDVTFLFTHFQDVTIKKSLHGTASATPRAGREIVI